jgi:bifunctional DNA-binding transcriptional regulator/antitoxin component of YhaV-PrlF toxin-antitoxin module
MVMIMPVKFEVSVMQNEKSIRITIPKELAAHLELKKSDTVVMWADNSHVIMEKKATKT